MNLATVVSRVVMECDLEASTVKQYHRAVQRFSEFLGRPAITVDLTHDNINGFLVALKERKLQNTTIRNYRVCLTRFWNFLTEVENYPEYSIRRLRRPKANVKPVYSWQPDEVEILLRASQDLLKKLRCGIDESEFMAAWIQVGYDTGIRPVDLRLLTWDEVNFHTATVAISQHKTGVPHTGSLSVDSIAALLRIQNPERDRVFPLTKGGMRRLELALFREAKRYGFTRRFGQGIGTLRKTHATAIYIEEGEVAAAESLGHKGGVRTVRASYIDHRAVKKGRLPVRISKAKGF